jgi:hypothetical protein
MSTTYPGTIGPVRFSGTHALDKYRRLNGVHHGILGLHLPIQIQAGEDSGAFTVGILTGFVFLGTRGYVGNAVFNHLVSIF